MEKKMKRFRRVDNGMYFVRSDKLWMICDDCGKMVCVNKWLFGSLHSCLTDEERKTRDEQTTP